MNGQTTGAGNPGSNPGTGAPGAGAAPPATVLGADGAAPGKDAAAAGGASAGAVAATPPAGEAGKKPETVLGADGKAKEGEAAAPAAEWAPKFPEGFQANEKDLGDFKAWVKEHGLKGEAAQKLVDIQVSAAKRMQEQAAADRLQQAKDWESELRADKDFGGDKYDTNVQLARKGIAAVGSPELKKFFAEHPLGNHPLLVKAFAKVGAGIGEGELKGTSAEGGTTPANSKSAFHKQMYPKSYEQMNGRR